MSVQTREERILTAFSRQVKRDKNLRNGFLLVHSEKHTIDLAIAEGTDRQSRADIQQSVYLASVGKLFTATLIGILSERGHLKIDAPIGRYLDADLMHGLHVLKGKEYSAEITVRHLLMQTSGLYDVFYHLLKRMMKTPGVSITPRDAIEWGKAHLKPAAVPGKKHFYTDTNYHLLGMIVENITGKAFHESLHELIFDPLGMHHAYMHGFSKPRIEAGYPKAQAYFHGHDLLSMQGYHQIDYAGGGVVAPLSEYLLFMKALVNHKLLKNETLSRMIEDSRAMGFPVLPSGNTVLYNRYVQRLRL
jgi:D-alanyl-D-alanine carboxypeptidase